MPSLICFIIDILNLRILNYAMISDGAIQAEFVQSGPEAVRLLLERVRQHRLRRNWSQAEMARRARLSRAAYQNFETGHGNITLRNLMKVLWVLGFTHQLAQMVPPVPAEPTPPSPTKPPRQRSYRRRTEHPTSNIQRPSRSD
jgi:DNA-binding XRE family transcriptional regulator